MTVFFLLVAILGCVLAKPSNEIRPAEVTVYYESLCDACMDFIPNQLLPTYTDEKYDFRSLFSKLTLIPYGWVHVLNATTREYDCQHGPDECQGNRLHACAIKYIPDQVTTLKYIACLDNVTADSDDDYVDNPVYPIDACQDALPAGLYPKILNCYNSDEGWELFERNGKLTKAMLVGKCFVPYVSFNNKRDDDLADKALSNFRATLCQVTGAQDPACTSSLNSDLQNMLNSKSYNFRP